MKSYVELAINTEPNVNQYDKAYRRLTPQTMRLLHAAMGLATEAGEFLDMIKKHIYYGREIDVVNLIEELGDSFWYAAIAADALGVDFSDIQRKNILKLEARYPLQFTEDSALIRDLKTERDILENK